MRYAPGVHGSQCRSVSALCASLIMPVLVVPFIILMQQEPTYMDRVSKDDAVSPGSHSAITRSMAKKTLRSEEDGQHGLASECAVAKRHAGPTRDETADSCVEIACCEEQYSALYKHYKTCATNELMADAASHAVCADCVLFVVNSHKSTVMAEYAEAMRVHLLSFPSFPATD